MTVIYINLTACESDHLDGNVIVRGNDGNYQAWVGDQLVGAGSLGKCWKLIH